jgi:hypothetical protein
VVITDVTVVVVEVVEVPLKVVDRVLLAGGTDSWTSAVDT